VRSRSGIFCLLVALGAALSASPVLGHGRSHSYSSWQIDPMGAQVRVRISELDLTRLPMALGTKSNLTPRLAPYVTRNIRLFVGGDPCPVAGPTRARATPDGWAVYEWGVLCSTEGDLTILSELLLDVTSAHLHFARVALPDGTVLERVLSQAAARWEVVRFAGEGDPVQSAGTSLLGYLTLGIEHILSGWDHLAFVLALLLLAGTIGEVATLVTGFTVAHSVTLGLAVFGLVRPEPVAVEALIGFSITLVAAENLWLLAGRDRIIPASASAALLGLALLASVGVGALRPLTLIALALFTFCHFGLLARVDRPTRLRVAVAFAFGLVHGFGFAGVLAEMELPRGRLVPALFGFNLGVEVGQITVVLLVWPLLRLLSRARTLRWHRSIAELSSAAIGGLGLFWFVTRIFG